MFVLSLLALPAILLAIPADYFSRDNTLAARRRRWTAWAVVGLIAKNLLGALLLCAGVLMLFTPGQGILGILAGLWLMDLPGKRRLEITIVGRPGVLKTLNRIRVRFGRAPFEPPRILQNVR